MFKLYAIRQIARALRGLGQRGFHDCTAIIARSQRIDTIVKVSEKSIKREGWETGETEKR